MTGTVRLLTDTDGVDLYILCWHAIARNVMCLCRSVSVSWAVIPSQMVASWYHSHLSGAVASAVEATAQGTSAGAHDSADIDFCLANGL